jgi:hypothetical protein
MATVNINIPSQLPSIVGNGLKYLRVNNAANGIEWQTFPIIPTVTPSNVTAASSKITLAGTPTGAGLQPFSIDVNEANLTLNNIGGTLGISKGGTNLTSLGSALQQLRVNAGGTSLEYFTPSAGGGITIGVSAITSGTVNRILFEGAGNVVQQDSTFVWENTDKRLILGTEVVASPNSRCVIIGKGTGTNQTFAVHNSTGTNNTIIATDNGRIGFGALPYGGVEVFRFRSGADNNLGLSSITGGIRLTSLNDGNSAVQILSFGGSSFTFLGSGATLFTTINSTSLTSNVKIISILNGADVVPFEVNNANGGGGALASIDFKQNNIITSKIRSKQEVVAGGTGELQIFVKSENTPSPYGLTQIATFFSNSLSIGQTTETASSILTLSSTTKGFLPPRMTTVQRDAIASPATGLVIYNTTTNKLNVYTTAWEAVTSL